MRATATFKEKQLATFNAISTDGEDNTRILQREGRKWDIHALANTAADGMDCDGTIGHVRSFSNDPAHVSAMTQPMHQQ